jgi:hypothetical protein
VANALKLKLSAPDQPISPQREQLALAISERDAAEAEWAALNQAASWNGPAEASVRLALEAVDTAKEAIDRAKQNAVSVMMASSLGTIAPLGQTVTEARHQLAVAEDQLVAATEARDSLQAQLKFAEDHRRYPQSRVREAALSVIMAEGGLDRIVADADRLQRALYSRSLELQWYHGHNLISAKAVQVGPFDSEFPPVAIVLGRNSSPVHTWHGLAAVQTGYVGNTLDRARW